MAITSSQIQEAILNCLRSGTSRTTREIKQYLESSGIRDYTPGQFSGSINTLCRQKNIKCVSRGTYRIMSPGDRPEKKVCFVVSPIGDDGSPTRDNADKLFRHILGPVCRACGFEALRADQINDTDSITQTIMDKLASAELVIADITEHNPNVFYEMGYRKCLAKPLIHLKRKGEVIPFDVNTIRTIEYDLTDLDGVEAVKERIQNTIQTFSFGQEDTSSPEQEVDSSLFSNILPTLYQIQDSLEELKGMVSKRENEVIETIMQTSLKNAPREEDPNLAMMKLLLPKLLESPEMLQNLMKLSDAVKKVN